jgi:hypothetical protein
MGISRDVPIRIQCGFTRGLQNERGQKDDTAGDRQFFVVHRATSLFIVLFPLHVCRVKDKGL